MRRRPLILATLATAGTPPGGRAQTAAARGVGPRPLVFALDHGSHPDTRIEWWYATGWLQPVASPASAEPAYGFQLTFFRSPTGVATDHPSRFAAHQLIFAHAALSDVSARRLRHDQRAARAVLDIAGAATGDTRAWLRDWQLVREPAVGGGRYRASCSSAEAGFALELTLTTTQPLLLQGDAGLSRKGPQPHQASHYYSQPQLASPGPGDARRAHARGARPGLARP